MSSELEARAAKARGRRKFYDEKDVDYINAHNERRNKRLEKEYGKYTADIKANLEHGTALPDV